MGTIIFLFIAGFFRGLAERIGFYHDESIFSAKVKPTSFFGSQMDRRKWKSGQLGLLPAPKTWYYKLFDLKYQERFPLSATLFVFVTDAFHFSNFLMRYSLTGAIMLAFWSPMAINSWWTGVLITFYIFAAYSLGFFLSFNLIFQRR